MKLELKDFQLDAVADLLRVTAKAARDAADDDELSAVVFSAPTGSGKTVMTTAWMESILTGTEERPADPDATFLWITDQPELNAQTRRKMVVAATEFSPGDLITVENDFKAPVLSPGKVYFLNTQKLGKNSALTQRSNFRQHTIWDIVATTLAARPASFWVVIDEAHRGMGTTGNGGPDVARTLVQRFIKGHSDVGLSPVPLIFGLSATPQRFERLLEGTTRTKRSVAVAPEAVRSSGLLKETISLFHPEEKQPSDLTMLKSAAERLKRYEEHWNLHATVHNRAPFTPVLVVQVADGTGKQVSRTDLVACLNILEDELGPLAHAEVAHAFQEQSALTLADNRQLRYVAPSDIEDDDQLRVVFFKTSLTTGWDCPRAEVMMSFRKAVDETLIAQLVGRMVRTPLAQEVTDDEFLNTVSLYLPNYDERAVEKVIDYLTEYDAERGTGITGAQKGNELVTFTREDGTDDLVAHAESLPTYRIERAAKQSAVRRLLRFGRELAWDKIEPDALANYQHAIVAILEAERATLAGTPEFDQRVADAATIDVREVAFAYGKTAREGEQGASRQAIAAVPENIDHAFAEAGRRLAGGMHTVYLRLRHQADPATPLSTIKQELYALVAEPGLLERCENEAERLLTDDFDRHKHVIRALSDPERKARYRAIRRAAGKPVREDWTLLNAIEVPVPEGSASLSGHVFVDEQHAFRVKLNDWERETTDGFLADTTVVAWLRNVERKSWALSIPYEIGGELRPLYPDFIVFRRVDEHLVADILDPHGTHLMDSVPRARGLAKFADEHREDFGRIELMAKVDGTMRRLPLQDPAVCAKVRTVSSDDHLKQLLIEHG